MSYPFLYAIPIVFTNLSDKNKGTAGKIWQGSLHQLEELLSW